VRSFYALGSGYPSHLTRPRRWVAVELSLEKKLADGNVSRLLLAADRRSSSICEAWNLWTQVEDQGGADQTEAESRRDERNQHSGCKARKDNE
jgi:hypothetical protein